MSELSPAFVDIGQSWCGKQIDALAGHYASDQWPLGEDDVRTVHAPAWLQTQEWADEDDTSGESAEGEAAE